MRLGVWAALAALIIGGLNASCADEGPTRSFDCAAITNAYQIGCGGHLGISDDTSACEAVRTGQNGPLAKTIERAARVCEEATADVTALESCDPIFVCIDDAHGLSAVTRDVRVSGRAMVEGEVFIFEDEPGWAWVGTKPSGNPGDFEVLFTDGGRPWYFRLDDFAVRARTRPFAVDAARPIKLENALDNVELVSGEVDVEGFAIGGAFDVAAHGTDDATGEVIDVRFVGSFAE